MSSYACHYCNRHTYSTAKQAKAAGRDDMARTWDHTVPQCKGGTETVVCCFRCNQAKADGRYEDFKAFASIFLRGRAHRNVVTTMFAFDVWVAAKILS